MAGTRRLSLTFDNGPDPSVTHEVLDALAERSLPATFFAVGAKARGAGREALLRAREAGHAVGNHTMHHTRLASLTAEEIDEEIEAAQRALAGVAGPDRLFRPAGSGGHLGPDTLPPAAVAHLVRHSYTCVLWNAVPRDWEDPVGWVDTALEQVAAHDWTVLVLHDLPTGAMDRLPAFLDGVLAAGVQVVEGFPDDCTPIRDGARTGPLPGEVTTR